MSRLYGVRSRGVIFLEAGFGRRKRLFPYASVSLLLNLCYNWIMPVKKRLIGEEVKYFFKFIQAVNSS
jgi:hypothetical protein